MFRELEGKPPTSFRTVRKRVSQAVDAVDEESGEKDGIWVGGSHMV